MRANKKKSLKLGAYGFVPVDPPAGQRAAPKRADARALNKKSTKLDAEF